MRSVALKTLEDEVTAYVNLAKKGETVLITEQDHVIAELTPPAEARRVFGDNPALAEAIGKGWITPAELVSEEPPARLPVAPSKSCSERARRGAGRSLIYTDRPVRCLTRLRNFLIG